MELNKNIQLTDNELIDILEIARVALSDENIKDFVANELDLADEVVEKILKKIVDITG